MVVVAFSCLTTHHSPGRLLAAVAVPEPLDVLVSHFQGSVGDFRLPLLPDESLLRHLLRVRQLHGLHLHGLGLGDLPLSLACQGAGAGLMP